jgi:hypothetical protein
MKAYLPVVMNKTTGKVCTDPNGAYDEYVGAIYGLAE